MKKISCISDALKDDKTHMWSFSRLAGAILLIWVFIVSSTLVYFKGDITTNIVHVIELFMLFAGAAYGVNKGVSHFSKLDTIPTPDILNQEDDVEA